MRSSVRPKPEITATPYPLGHDGVLAEVVAGADGGQLGRVFGGLAACRVPAARSIRQVRVPPHTQTAQDLQ